VTTAHGAAGASGAQIPFGTEALFGLMHLHATVVRAIDEALVQAHGTGLTGYELLLRLSSLHPDGASVRFLSDHVVVSSSRVSRVTDELVGRGLLERAASPHDGRLSLVRLTPRGREQVAAMDDTFGDALRTRFTGRLTEEQVASLAGIANALGAPNCAEAAAALEDDDPSLS
jgi:DNA-binding MarR family transcriptional regulator